MYVVVIGSSRSILELPFAAAPLSLGAMPGPAKKRRRQTADSGALVAEILHQGRCSTRGLAKILQLIKDSPELANATKHDLQFANLASFDAVRKVIHLDAVDGGEPLVWELCDPNQLLAATLTACPALAACFAELYRVRKPTKDSVCK